MKMFLFFGTAASLCACQPINLTYSLEWADVYDPDGVADAKSLERALNFIDDAYPTLPKYASDLMIKISSKPIKLNKDWYAWGTFEIPETINIYRPDSQWCWGGTALAHEIFHWAMHWRSKFGADDNHDIGYWEKLVEPTEQSYSAEHCDGDRELKK